MTDEMHEILLAPTPRYPQSDRHRQLACLCRRLLEGHAVRKLSYTWRLELSQILEDLHAYNEMFCRHQMMRIRASVQLKTSNCGENESRKDIPSTIRRRPRGGSSALLRDRDLCQESTFQAKPGDVSVELAPFSEEKEQPIEPVCRENSTL
jgi:hypothetical protein